MTVFAFLSLLLRFIGFARWAGLLWEKHEAVVKAKEVRNAQANINRDSDADVVVQLRDKYTRD